ncbi:MAG: chromosome segregation ATPase [Cyanobacteria bacterium]|nr:chromosome segregation ATPase [Cyanobacteriota bacterium]MDW8201668.1 chromosome segregation ATPase [Cyanobacteriota bacterium SKYGB_h_bin112]
MPTDRGVSEWTPQSYPASPYHDPSLMGYSDYMDDRDDNDALAPELDEEAEADQQHPMQWLTHWQVWGAAAVVVFTGTGFFAAANLLHLPAVANCPAIFLPTASASMRLSCARAAAEKGTPTGYLEAINLVNGLPKNHALRPHIDDMIQQWAKSYLNLAEKAFQEGRIRDAIEAARRLPKTVPAYKQVDGLIQKWQSIWQRGELIFQATEAAMRKRDWGKAYALAARLLMVENEYWSTVKYRELSGKILLARQTNTKINRAMMLAEAGDVDSLLEAIDLLATIDKSDYLYAEAQKELKKISLQLLAIAQTSLDNQNYQDAMDILRRIPESAGLQDEIKDFTLLANAQSKAWKGSIADLQDAITQAEKISVQSALYGDAQRMIKRWRNDIDAVNRLAIAQQLAASGDPAGLASAISEASRISDNSNRWKDAQKKIDNWRQQLESLEDRPILNNAKALALAGDVAALSAAIAQASRVQPGRALYPEAQELVKAWRGQIEEFEDRPILDRALELANNGRFPEAIVVAEQIGSGRSLSKEARRHLRVWRDQVQGQERWEQARRLAASGSVADLQEAVRIAGQVPESSTYSAQAGAAVDQWSRRLLSIANERALQADFIGAIAIASQIPASTSTYAEAQERIALWRSQLSQ